MIRHIADMVDENLAGKNVSKLYRQISRASIYTIAILLAIYLLFGKRVFVAIAATWS